MPKIDMAAVHDLHVSATPAAKRTQQKPIGGGAKPTADIVSASEANSNVNFNLDAYRAACFVCQPAPFRSVAASAASAPAG